MSFRTGTLVTLIQPELFDESGIFVVLEVCNAYAEDQFTDNHNICKVLQCSTGKIFEWYADILEEIK